MRRYVGGIVFVLGLLMLGSMAMQPVSEGTGAAFLFIVFAMVIPGAIWLFRKPRA